MGERDILNVRWKLVGESGLVSECHSRLLSLQVYFSLFYLVVADSGGILDAVPSLIVAH